MTAAVVVIAVGLGTYVLRASMFVLGANRPLPARFQAPLAFVGPAAVAALVAGLAFTSAGRVAPRDLPELVAITAGFLVVRRTGNVIHAIAVGMPVVWLAAAIAG